MESRRYECPHNNFARDFVRCGVYSLVALAAKGVLMSERDIIIGLVIGIGVAIYAAIRAWAFWGAPFSPGEPAKDAMVRQYGPSRTWFYLILITLVGVVIGFLVTNVW